MERLVYSPKVYAWVEVVNSVSPPLGNNTNILNISDYIVSGNVHRVRNAVSTWQLSLRNPKKIFTPPDGQIFHPMDKITIFMERLPGNPVQVLTGFIDKAPIYQMYPGNITIQGSCTLKRLQYTYWDPALPFVITYLTERGWIADGNGTLTNWSSLSSPTAQSLSQTVAAAQNLVSWPINQSLTVDGGNFTQAALQYSTNADMSNAQTLAPGSANIKYTPSVSSIVQAIIPNLNTSTTYYYRLVGYDANGNLHYGNISSFSTPSTGNQSSLGPSFQLNDSSISRLINDIMQDIGGWNSDSFYVEPLPANLPQELSVLYNNLANNESVVYSQLTYFLNQIIGTGSYGTAGPTPYGSNQFTGTISNPETFALALLSALNITPTPQNIQNLLFWERAEGGAGPQWGTTTNKANYNPLNASQPETGSTDSGRGIQSYTSWQQGLQATVTTLKNGLYDSILQALQNNASLSSFEQTVASSPWGTQIGSFPSSLSGLYSYTPVPSNSSQSSPPNQKNNPTAGSNGLFGNIGNAINQAGKAIQNATQPQTTQTVTATNQGGNANNPSAQSSSGYSKPLKNMPKQLNVVDNSFGGIDQGVIILTGKVGDTVYNIAPGTVYFGHGGGPSSDSSGNKYGPNYPIVAVSDGPWKGRWIFYGYVQGIAGTTDGTTVKAGDPIGKIAFSLPKQTNGMGAIDIGFIQAGTGNLPQPWTPGQSPTPDAETMLINMRQLISGDTLTPSSNSPNVGIDASNNTANQATIQSLATSASFNTVFGFPSIENIAAAMMLTGDKSYMNDQPLLPFIQQLCQGSLREFQSMPNGDFFAFYPDYFGSFGQRNPYWEIEDIEILDGGINITDEALATHVFVAGDTIVPNANQVTVFDEIVSPGVVSIENAGLSNILAHNPSNFNQNSNLTTKQNPLAGKDQTTPPEPGDVSGTNTNFLSTPSDIIAFLQRYGVRPLVELEPFIHNYYFELFMAYQLFQLLWARQYETEFTFTFMPELYPGGVVGFPNHGIAMYINEVYHEFDYTQGFTTRANLMAPQAYTNVGSPVTAPFTQGLIVRTNLQSGNPAGS